jgi:glucokinase
MSEKIIGIDIGATKIHIGLVEDSKVIKEIKFPTLANASRDEIINNLINKIGEVDDPQVVGIGIGVPGLVDEENGIIYDLTNIPSWKEVHLKKELEDRFKKPVRITNDANVFALGEKIFGDGGAYKNLVGVTLGTGFGSGIIINHQLYSGTLSSAGELGNIPYLDKTIEDYCSGKFFFSKYGLKGGEVNSLAEKGDASARKMFDEFGLHLGNALKIIMNVLSPEAIFLGGSVSQSYEFFKEPMEKSLDSYPFKKVRDQLVIQPSRTSDIAILGAAALVVSYTQQNAEITQN